MDGPKFARPAAGQDTVLHPNQNCAQQTSGGRVIFTRINGCARVRQASLTSYMAGDVTAETLRPLRVYIVEDSQVLRRLLIGGIAAVGAELTGCSGDAKKA